MYFLLWYLLGTQCRIPSMLGKCSFELYPQPQHFLSYSFWQNRICRNNLISLTGGYAHSTDSVSKSITKLEQEGTSINQVFYICQTVPVDSSLILTSTCRKQLSLLLKMRKPGHSNLKWSVSCYTTSKQQRVRIQTRCCQIQRLHLCYLATY